MAVARSPTRWEWLLLAVLVVAVLLVYQPAWRGGFVWDDDAHVTKPELRSWHGLYRIWFDLGATQQYYPLLHSAFWVEHRLWGDATLGYHLVNILLHAAAAVLVAVVLCRLSVPGAYLAAAIFALHPVHVESVAWITEQKNTLSAVFYLGAMLVYLRFDRQRKTPLYCWALGLFVLGLLSKTTAATLPAALLVIFWWQRGRLSWRGDVLPLAPFFALGMVAGVFTAWVERNLGGAVGASYELTIVERCLLAGRAIWFYLGKLFWPTELIFIYPRWQVSQTVCWQYLFPAAALLLLAGCWALRRRWRGPLAGLLFFVGTLLPALGFCNVFPFLYSFVADHFQYLASLGVITLVSAGVTLLLRRWGFWNRPAGYAACLLLLATLGTLTWRQSRMYRDIDTLYLTTIDRNPDCWMAHNNLGNVLQSRGRIDEALAHYQKALEINPRYAEAQSNLGVALASRGGVAEAITHFRKALEINPRYAEGHNNLGLALAGRGQVNEAIDHYQKALQIKPAYAKAENNFGAALAGRGKLAEAITHFRKALEISPDYAEALYNLGNALAGLRRIDEAVAHYRKALELNPRWPDVHNNLGFLLASRGRLGEAIDHYRQALQIQPGHVAASRNLDAALQARKIDAAIPWFQQAVDIRPDDVRARNQLGKALAARGRPEEALAQYRQALQTKPDDAEAHYNLAWLRATCPQASLRNGAEAIEHARRADRLCGSQRADVLDALAAAYAEAGRFADALTTARKALDLATRQKAQSFADVLRTRIALYEAGKPFHEAPPGAVPPIEPRVKNGTGDRETGPVSREKESNVFRNQPRSQ